MGTVACTICGEILTIDPDGDHACDMPEGQQDRLRGAVAAAVASLEVSLRSTPGMGSGAHKR